MTTARRTAAVIAAEFPLTDEDRAFIDLVTPIEAAYGLDGATFTEAAS